MTEEEKWNAFDIGYDSGYEKGLAEGIKTGFKSGYHYAMTLIDEILANKVTVLENAMKDLERQVLFLKFTKELKIMEDLE